MGARIRTRSFGISTPGNLSYSGLGPPGAPSDRFPSTGVVLSREVCNDTTMPRPYTVDHGLSIEKILVRPGVINGRKFINALYGDCVVSNYRIYPAGVAWPNLTWTPFNENYFRTAALANASPYQSSLNVPLFSFELRELPSMLQQLGRVLKKQVRPSDVAGGYLAYSFGWAPLVKDLLSLLDMSKKIEDRKAYFRKLESGTVVKRSLGTRTVRKASILNDQCSHVGSTESAIFYKGHLELEETQSVWYTVNAKLKKPLDMTESELWSMSRNQILGLRLNPSDLWDAIPWSWLIDYFANIGDNLEASNALVGITFTRMNLMCYSYIAVTSVTDKLQGGFEVSPGFVHATKKQRFPYSNPTPRPSVMPFFTEHMAGILGSLAVVKGLKARGYR